MHSAGKTCLRSGSSAGGGALGAVPESSGSRRRTWGGGADYDREDPADGIGARAAVRVPEGRQAWGSRGAARRAQVGGARGGGRGPVGGQRRGAAVGGREAEDGGRRGGHSGRAAPHVRLRELPLPWPLALNGLLLAVGLRKPGHTRQTQRRCRLPVSFVLECSKLRLQSIPVYTGDNTYE